MTLDEAIKRAEEVAEEKEKLANAYESFKDYGNPKSSITSGHEKCLRCAKEHRQLAEWLKELKQLREQTMWIPVSERLPEVGIDVLICNMEGAIYLSHRLSTNSYFDEFGNKIKNIRAWMLLPEPYKAESEGKK